MAKIVPITSFKGMNNTDPASTLAPDVCVLLRNVDLFNSPLGSRRNGISSVTLSAGLAAETGATWLFRHLPTADETAAQLWVWGVSVGTSTLAYKDTSWHTVSQTDALTVGDNTIYQISGATLNGMLYIAYNSSADRLHVWDGSSLRRVSLATLTTAPTAADSGGAGTFSGTRYYRTRETVMSGSTVTLRSEYSATLTKAPSGANASLTVTKPTTVNSNATHWEIEASVDNANFYRMAQIAIGTTTHVDSVVFATGYAATGTLSDDAGDHTNWPSVRILLAEDDRLIGFGSFEDATAESTVRWSVVGSDSTGPSATSNYERIPTDTDNILNLDPSNGGAITNAKTLNGVIYVTKASHIYKLVRTGQRERAYEAICLSKTTGAVEGSVVEGVDQNGAAVLYGLDPKIGFWRLGPGGLMRCGMDIYETVKTLNYTSTAFFRARAIFYPDKLQVHWFVTTGSSTYPDTRLVLQTDLTEVTPDGVRGGWVNHTGANSSLAYSTCLFATNIEAGAARTLALKPFIGGAGAVYMMDAATTTDNATTFTATITTAPILVTNTPAIKSGIRAGEVTAEANSSCYLSMTLVRDFGAETSTAVTVRLDASGSETIVQKTLDNYFMSTAKAIQVGITDGASNADQWTLHRIDLVARDEERS